MAGEGEKGVATYIDFEVNQWRNDVRGCLQEIFQGLVAPRRVVVTNTRRPWLEFRFDAMTPSLVTLHFGARSYAPERKVLPHTEKDLNLMEATITDLVPQDLEFSVGLYSISLSEVEKLEQRLVESIAPHDVINGVGFDQIGYSNLDGFDKGVFQRVFRYRAWVWRRGKQLVLPLARKLVTHVDVKELDVALKVAEQQSLKQGGKVLAKEVVVVKEDGSP